ncbi:MAG: polysaccharide deacetylase family protein [Firmicutes bacterium]|nr:polysaccharide deacetylase family protein [Bacillota bacterium]
MRYSSFTAVSGRKLLSVILILLILPYGISSCTGLLRRKTQKVAEGVVLGDVPLGGLTAAESRVVIEQLARIRNVPPVDACLDETTGGVIPALCGLEIDVDATLERVLAAGRGEMVVPHVRSVPPAVTLADFKQYPVYRGNPAKKQVAFLINVAWGNEFLPEMLEVLREAGAQATFFLVGRWVENNRQEAEMLAASGFEIASHGYSDAISLGEAPLSVVEEDLRRAGEIITAVCGKRPQYFSPHKGELSPSVLAAAAAQNYRVIMWTLDTVDWKLPGVDAMYEKIIQGAEGGSMILMHPTEQTAAFLRRIIPALREKGLEPKTVGQLLSPDWGPGE